jgi:DNA invertase Pin-like site-specific DNA recombinase
VPPRARPNAALTRRMVSCPILPGGQVDGDRKRGGGGGVALTAGDGDPTRVLIRQVLGAVSQFEKAVIVSKLKAARQRKKRATGRCEGRKPFGERPGEAEVVAYIAKLRRKPKGAERRSFAAIAERLNAERIPSRTGRP